MSRTLDKMVDAFQDELQKIASFKVANSGGGGIKGKLVKPLAVAGAGALGFEALRRANEDRRNGRVMRLQQGGLF